MQAVAIVALLALVEVFVMGLLVGRARGTTGVQAPATMGHPVFERTFRAHQNTLEQLVIFLPALWLFALYVNAPVAAGVGLVFVVARVLYFRGYVAEAGKRSTGMAISSLCQAVLVVGALVGAVGAWLRAA